MVQECSSFLVNIFLKDLRLNAENKSNDSNCSRTNNGDFLSKLPEANAEDVVFKSPN